MTLHRHEREVGVRELHDRLSEYLERVERGADVVVTRRGKRVARLSAVDADDPLANLARRGLLSLPATARSSRQVEVEGSGSVSDLIREQRR